MKMKFLLSAIVALVVSQSMQALEVVVFNNNKNETDVKTVSVRCVFGDPDSGYSNGYAYSLGYGESKVVRNENALYKISIQYDLTHDASVKFGSSEATWMISEDILESCGISLMGNHQLIVQVLDSSGKVRIADGNGAVIIHASPRLETSEEV